MSEENKVKEDMEKTLQERVRLMVLNELPDEELLIKVKSEINAFFETRKRRNNYDDTHTSDFRLLVWRELSEICKKQLATWIQSTGWSLDQTIPDDRFGKIYANMVKELVPDIIERFTSSIVYEAVRALQDKTRDMETSY